MEMNGTKKIPTSRVYSKDRSKLKEFPVDKLYRRSVLRTRMNKKASSLTNVLRRKTNQNAFTKMFTNKKTQKNDADYEEY